MNIQKKEKTFYLNFLIKIDKNKFNILRMLSKSNEILEGNTNYLFLITVITVFLLFSILTLIILSIIALIEEGNKKQDIWYYLLCNVIFSFIPFNYIEKIYYKELTILILKNLFYFIMILWGGYVLFYLNTLTVSLIYLCSLVYWSLMVIVFTTTIYLTVTLLYV